MAVPSPEEHAGNSIAAGGVEMGRPEGSVREDETGSESRTAACRDYSDTRQTHATEGCCSGMVGCMGRYTCHRLRRDKDHHPAQCKDRLRAPCTNHRPGQRMRLPPRARYAGPDREDDHPACGRALPPPPKAPDSPRGLSTVWGGRRYCGVATGPLGIGQQIASLLLYARSTSSAICRSGRGRLWKRHATSGSWFARRHRRRPFNPERACTGCGRPEHLWRRADAAFPGLAGRGASVAECSYSRESPAIALNPSRGRKWGIA